MGQNVSKREARIENGDLFKQVIKANRQFIYEKHKNDKKQPVDPDQQVTVFIRKRPIFKYEKEKKEYDVVTCNPNGKSIIVHDCRLKADLKRDNAYVENKEFLYYDQVFNENASNDEVYYVAGKSLVEHICLGGKGTAFMYGQTGSGKTYTMSAIQDRVCKDIFYLLDEMNEVEVSVSMSSFEMAGDKCFDLLNRRERVHLRQGNKGNVHVRGAVELLAKSPDELRKYIKRAAALRHTEGTHANSQSSRTHAVTRIFLRKPNKTQPDVEPELVGQLTLVDLAGSERNEDSMYHDADRRKECAEINTSLMALKNCIRKAAENAKNNTEGRIPYRAHKLTMLLKDSFTDKDVKTVVIATCSPIPTDTEHTMNTLKHVGMMNMNALDKSTSVVSTKHPVSEYVDTRPKVAKVLVAPGKWDTAETQKWICNVNGGKYKKYLPNFSSVIDGKQLMRYTEQRYTQCCDNNARAGAALRAAFLQEIEKYQKYKDARSRHIRNHNRRGQH